jgi:predicted transcriptional regulator
MRKDWQEVADKIKNHVEAKEPNIKVEEVKQLFGLSSLAVAYYYLLKLEDMGVVKRVQNGNKHEWFLAW